MNQFRRSSGEEAIDPQTALQAAKQIIGKAEAEGKKAAVAGGMAMQIFGFTRATKDVDVVASDSLALKSLRPLEFGGHIYSVRVGEKDIEVDWIVRSDDKRLVYEAALDNAEMTEHGFPVITPEWMVILKYLAGRGKDHIDLMWLLQQPELVAREKVIAIIESLMGSMAFWAKQDMESVFMEADFRKQKEKS
ncbi:MAG: hypothetical protein V1899_04825 [Planctomycetota bacterium]